MLWSVRVEKPDTWEWEGLPKYNFIRETNDFRNQEFQPLIDAIHKGSSFRTNEWGMRDKHYNKEKPSHTFRIAMLGSSYTVGAGVNVEEIFPSVLEQRLNDDPLHDDYTAYEVLNFAYGGDSILRHVARLRLRALEFDPDAIFDMATTNEAAHALINLRAAIQKRFPDIHPDLQQIILKAKIKPDMSAEEIERRLKPFDYDLVKWGYQQLAELATQHGIKVTWFLLPSTDQTDIEYNDEYQRLSELANEAGFITINLSDIYGDLNKRDSLKLSPWDWHPNSKGHAMIADRIYKELKESRHL